MSRLIFLLLTSSWLFACKRPAVEPAAPPLHVRCVRVTTEDLPQRVSLRGVVEVAPGFHALVAGQVAGRLTSLLVQEGQRVQKGDVLAEIDPRQASDAALQAQAALAGAEAGVQNARVSAERASRLLERGIASRQEVDDANAKLLSLKAAADGARAAVEVAKRNVAFATVRAPLGGVVLRTLRAPGDLVDGTPAAPICELGDPTKLNLLSQAAPEELIQLVLGQPGVVRFEALPGRSWDVEVKSIAPMIDPTSGVGVVRLAFRPVPTLPPIGLAGEVKIDVGTLAGAVTIPSTALRGAAAGGVEVLLCAEGHLHSTPVEVGVRAEGKVQVRSGLDAGQQLVPADVLGLEDGAAIEAQP